MIKNLEDPAPLERADRRQTVQSVEIGMHVLITLSRLGPQTSLSALAKEISMPASKAHRYLRALQDSGLVRQNGENGLYGLGPEAAAIGFAAIRELDIVGLAARPLIELRDGVDETTFLCVWGNHGPTVVRLEPAQRAVAINVRIGSVLPVLSSAAGQAFAAFSQDHHVKEVMAQELRAPLTSRQDHQEALAAIDRARQSGITQVQGTLTHGVSAIAAPVFDYQGHVAGVLAVMGPQSNFDATLAGPVVAQLRQKALGLGQALGHRADI